MSEYQYYEFAATGRALTVKALDKHWIIDWSLDESENYDCFGMEDGSGAEAMARCDRGRAVVRIGSHRQFSA